MGDGKALKIRNEGGVAKTSSLHTPSLSSDRSHHTNKKATEAAPAKTDGHKISRELAEAVFTVMLE